MLVSAVLIAATTLYSAPAAAHEPSPRTPPQTKTGNCIGALPIVVASDAAAQSDMYSAVTLAGALGTDCIILAGGRDEPFPASELECLDAAASGGYVVGGTGAVPGSKISGRSLRRISGADRWKTAQAVGAEVQRVLATLDDAARKRNAGTGTASSRGCGTTASSDSQSGSANAELSAVEIFARVSPSIPIVRSCVGHGSGILIEGGYIVTNDHVIWNCREASTVLFPDGTEYTGVPVVASNPWADIAILGPIRTGKPKLDLADGEDLPPGSDLYLIGYPAEFEDAPQPSITRGILSRVRQWDSYDLTLLQTDASIAGGQSGGALVDSAGRVVGVSTWGWSGANFGIATSAVDDAAIIELMLDSEDYEYSFDWVSRLGETGSTQQRFTLPAGFHIRSFLIDHDGDDDVEVELHGCSDAWMWVADWFEPHTEFDDEGDLPRSLRLSADDALLSFVEVGGFATESASCRLQSNAELIEYFDETGVELQLDDGPARYAGVFDYHRDSDTYEIDLTQGDQVRIWVDSTNADTYLRFADSDGQLVAADDDSGPLDFLGGNLNAQVVYQVPSSGTYFIAVEYLPDSSRTSTGSYLLFVEKTN